MNVFLLEPCCPCLFIVLANVVIIIKGLDQRGSGSEVNNFSGEFENFLHGLGSMVYKYKKPVRRPSEKNGNGQDVEYGESTQASTKTYQKNENVLRTQKEVLKDVLMMKLVSYYEDKYKIMHTENQDMATTTSSASAMVNSLHTYNEYDELPNHYTFDERSRNIDRRTKMSRTSQQPRRQFRNTIMHRDMAEVIVL